MRVLSIPVVVLAGVFLGSWFWYHKDAEVLPQPVLKKILVERGVVSASAQYASSTEGAKEITGTSTIEIGL